MSKPFYKIKTTLLIIWMSVPLCTIAQITARQARPIDSALVVQYLQFGNFHTTNYHDLPGEGVFTWDAGNGLYAGISDYAVAWSHTGSVEDTLAVILDSTPGQAYHLFNLALIPDPAVYLDTVTNWLASLGISVGVLPLKAASWEVWATRTGFQITFPENGPFELLIFNIEGKRIHIVTGEAVAGTNRNIQLNENQPSVLLIELQYQSSNYVRKVMW